MRIIVKLKWFLNGKPMIKYPGYTCGCCGAGVMKEFEVPEWNSAGEWWDTWGLCEECIEGAKEHYND